MTVRILRTHELTIPIHTGDQISRIIPRKIDVTEKTKYLVKNTDWEQEILKGEKFVNLFCWSLFGLSALYFGMFCSNMLGK